MTSIGGSLTIILICFIGCLYAQSIPINQVLELPLATGPFALLNGGIDPTTNKGYSVLNTTSGNLLIRFTAYPMAFSSTDYVYAIVSVTHANGAYIDATNSILYIYGTATLQIGNGSVASIQSFNISGGTELVGLSTYSAIASDYRGFITAFTKSSSSNVYTNVIRDSNTVLFELDLSTDPATVVHSTPLSPSPDGQNYLYGTSVSTALNTNEFFFLTEGTVNTTSPNGTPVVKVGTPTIGSFDDTFPWSSINTNPLISNSTVHKVVGCAGESYVAALISYCQSGVCNSYSVVTIDATLEVTNNLFLAHLDSVSRTSLYCFSSQNQILATMGNKFYRANISTSTVDSGYYPAYKEFVWVSAASNGSGGNYAYVGANPYSESDSSSVLQLAL